MTKFLAIETTAQICSVALNVDGVITVKEAEGAKSHTQSVLGFIDELLSASHLTVPELDAIIFAAGPGAFTGVRLAASVAKSLAYAANIPLVAISSLAAIAQTAFRLTGGGEPCLVITDARMGDVYKGHYMFDNGVARPLCEDVMVPATELKLDKTIRIIGDAQPVLGQQFFSHFHSLDISAKAEDLLVLGAADFASGLYEDALSAQAVYLRDKTSWKNTAQQLAEKADVKK